MGKLFWGFTVSTLRVYCPHISRKRKVSRMLEHAPVGCQMCILDLGGSRLRYTYSAIFAPVKRGYVVSVPDIPEVVTEGNSIEQATEYATDAIQLVRAEYIRRKSEIPRPSKSVGKRVRMVELPLLTQAKLSLYTAMRRAGVRKADLPRRLGISKPQVERLLDLGHGSNLHQVERAFRALKKRLELSVKDAA